MPLKYLIDEHLRGDFLESLRIAAQQAGSFLDACQIGDPQAPGLAALHPDILLWCQAHDRVLISRDVRTLPGHLAAHLAAGRSCPGILMIRSGQSWQEVLDDPVLLAEVSRPDEWRNRILYVPL